MLRRFFLGLAMLLCSCQSEAKEPPRAPPSSAPTQAASKPVVAPEVPTNAISVERASTLLYPEGEDDTLRRKELEACEVGDAPAKIICLLERRYPNKKDAALFITLYNTVGVVAGVELAHTREVGYRGIIQFVPEPPIGAYQQQLLWVLEGFTDIDTMLRSFETIAKQELPFRWTDLELKFYRTIKRKTPNAYATRWEVAYNVVGSMFTSQAVVTETLVHEIFHLNDEEHGVWSVKVLNTNYLKILKECAVKGKKVPDTKCLTPYSPGSVKVTGGTYYSFQPGNDVREYAAELALRYYQEQHAYWREDKKKPKPFKCMTQDNADNWKLFVDEFFLGIDLVPECEKIGP
jgi:hypothetical protein